ncbi:E-selectin isoform X2 [Pleuronectes platessa]|uniref:E-selectin isoform X2 n=1 Tax=Pleuronectes platessa TaxID=8262 RepID=UPI00232A3049|nr:E-selectin isoform X2 [Pleuronectes platessa]
MEFCFGLFPTRGSKISWISQMLLCSMLCMWTTVESWSYFYSNTTMDWEHARSWCRKHYTDMVAIQNQDEIGHLNAWLPRQRNYYWIGIRKINDDWTWVGTNKTLTAEASSWAEGEPNNRKQKGSRESEDCVEMYIKRETQPGKWNDERCGKKKTALCFAAACKNDSCGYGDCVETINSHTCACFEGFYGEKCEKVVKCDKEKVTVPYKGSVKCTHKYGNFSFDSSCEYSCEEGYELSMSRPLRCTGSKEWSDQPPTCEAVQCPELSRPEGGSMDCFAPLGPSRYQTTCVFACDEGFIQAGSSSDPLQCEASGRWNATQPSCVAITCQNPEGAPHLITTCSRSSSELRLGSTCSFDCGAGFVLQGADNVQCSGDGRWSRAIPTCKEMECPAPEIPSSGRIFCSLPLSSSASPETPHPLGMVCNFTCDEGHELEGAPSMECDHPGQWTSSPPTCTAVQCLELSRPEGGSMDCFAPLGPSRYQTTCVFACDEGFVQAGSSSDTLQCEASGRWNATQPSCVAITCQNPEGAPHLINTCSSSSSELRLGSTCSFDCGAGFVLQGADTVQCAGDGRWSRTIPTCKEMECPAPEIPSSGRIFCSLPLSSSASPETPHPLGMVCNFTCDEGHELEGAPSMECDHPGQWTSSPPTCTAVQCLELTRPEGGSMDCFAPLGPSRYQTTCVFACDEGFVQAGSSSDPLQCEASGRWNATQPSCVALRCPSLEAPENGHINCSNSDPVFNTQCSFTCTPEYSLDGHELLNCDRHGNWTGERPTCQASPSKLSAITSGVAAGGALLSGLSLAFWILKRLKLRKDTFELSSNSDIEAPPQVYKNSLDSLI